MPRGSPGSAAFRALFGDSERTRASALSESEDIVTAATGAARAAQYLSDSAVPAVEARQFGHGKGALAGASRSERIDRKVEPGQLMQRAGKDRGPLAAGVTFRVAKNRLAHLTLEGTRFDGIKPMLTGPTLS